MRTWDMRIVAWSLVFLGTSVIAEEEEKPKIRHEGGKTTLEFKEGSLSISNRAQLRFVHEWPDTATGGGSGGLVPSSPVRGDRGSFRIRRAKTEITGWMWNEHLTYEIQLSWAGPEPGASTQTPLEDLTLSYDISKKGTFVITGGQFKVPMGRQEMTSSSKMQFVERDLLSGEFSRGRDVGLQISGLVGEKKVEYRLGVFNGNPAARIENENDKFQFNARVTLMPFGEVKYSEGDFESADKPLLAIAAELEHNDQHGSTNADDFLTTVLGGDVVFKYKGFSAFAEYFHRKREPETGSSFDSPGFHVQAGYFVVRDRFEVAGRYASYDPTDAIASNDLSEYGGAMSYYIQKHLLKIQADFLQRKDKARNEKDKELRVHTYFTF